MREGERKRNYRRDRCYRGYRCYRNLKLETAREGAEDGEGLPGEGFDGIRGG